MIFKTDRKVMLSTLWIFATLNYIYADVFSLFFLPGAQQEAMASVGRNQWAILGFAVLMETAIAMVLLARILKYKTNRWANIIIGAIHTLIVVGTFSGGTLYYRFFATIEIACTLFIVWYAWKWKNDIKQGVLKNEIHP